MRSKALEGCSGGQELHCKCIVWISWEPWGALLCVIGPDLLQSLSSEDVQGLFGPPNQKPINEDSLKRHPADSVQLAETGPFATIHQVWLSAQPSPDPLRMHFPFV